MFKLCDIYHLSCSLDGVRLETSVFGKSGFLPDPDKVFDQIESGITEVCCILKPMKESLIAVLRILPVSLLAPLWRR